MMNISKRIFSLLCALFVLLSVMAMAIPEAYATEVDEEQNSDLFSYTFLADDITLPYSDAGMCDSRVDDPDSKHGRAVKMSYEERLATGDAGLYNTMIYPATSILSIYTCDGKEGKTAGFITSEELQENALAGEYRTYRFNGVDMTGATFIYMYNCWGLQVRFSEEQLSTIQGKMVNIALSMKVTGDVTNPANPPSYFIEEITISETDPNAVHIHSFGDWRYVDEYTHEMKCNAGDGCTEGQSGEHDWGEAVVTKEPTDTERGEMTFTCEVCKGTKVRTFGGTNNTAATTPSDNKTQPQSFSLDPVLVIAVAMFTVAVVIMVIAIIILKRGNKKEK